MIGTPASLFLLTTPPDTRFTFWNNGMGPAVTVSWKQILINFLRTISLILRGNLHKALRADGPIGDC